MTEMHPVWITGIGLLSSHGEGTDANWSAFKAGKPANVEAERFAPYLVHTLGEVDWSTQISRRDMRQMEPWQQIGTYAAGLALDDAGAKGDEELCGRMDMIVAAGGGERDIEVDTAIMNEARTSNDRDAMLNERLSNDLRPTLFLAQLSNLLAGNISIVHKVTGSSRTFMGEEGAGISAVKTAHARIASGQSDIVLVGGGFNGEREDMLLLFELGHFLTRGEWKPVWSRKDSPGLALASIGVFLVLESADHAKRRGAKPYAELGDIVASHGRRDKIGERLSKIHEQLPDHAGAAIFSGASGTSDATEAEQDFLSNTHPEAPVRAYGSVFGHGIEAVFPLGIALAALSLNKGEIGDPIEDAEVAANGAPERVVVTTVGHFRAEGLGLVKKADGETR